MFQHFREKFNHYFYDDSYLFYNKYINNKFINVTIMRRKINNKTRIVQFLFTRKWKGNRRWEQEIQEG